jgi:hypothetical protein
MGRTVVTARDVVQGSVASAEAPAKLTQDTYQDRLLKYIPADIVAIYVGLLGVLKTANPQTTPIVTVQWVVFFVILVLTIPWQRKIVKIEKWQQVAIGTVAFVFWAISLGQPFETSWKPWYQPLYGTMAMMLYTFLIPLFEPQ